MLHLTQSGSGDKISIETINLDTVKRMIELEERIDELDGKLDTCIHHKSNRVDQEHHSYRKVRNCAYWGISACVAIVGIMSGFVYYSHIDSLQELNMTYLKMYV